MHLDRPLLKAVARLTIYLFAAYVAFWVYLGLNLPGAAWIMAD